MRVAEPIETDAQTEQALRALSNGRRVEARVKQRASVVLLAAQGWQNKDIAEEVKLDRRQVALWRRRFIEGGLQALLKDASRSGAPRVTSEIESLIVSTTLHRQPPTAATWSSRALASHLGVSATTVRRVWQRNGLRPPSQDSAPRSHDPHHVERCFIDVVGLWVNAREHALLLCQGEVGQPHEHNVVRLAGGDGQAGDDGYHDLAVLLAALEALDDVASGLRPVWHHHLQWPAFLRLLERYSPGDLQLHLIVDAHADHEDPEVQAWLAAHPRVVVHWQPAGVPWLKWVEGIFRGICVHPAGHQHFASVPGLQRAIARYIDSPSVSHRPFVWSSGACDNALVDRAEAAAALVG